MNALHRFAAAVLLSTAANAMAGGGRVYQDFSLPLEASTWLPLNVQLVSVAKDDGSDPVAVEGFIDRAAVQALFDGAQIELNFLPVVQLDSTALYEVEDFPEAETVGDRTHPAAEVQAFFAAHRFDIIYFHGANRYGCAPGPGGDGFCGFGFSSGYVAYSAHGGTAPVWAAEHYAHEIGHCLGLNHTEAPSNLMFPGIPTLPAVFDAAQERTLREFAYAIRRSELLEQEWQTAPASIDGFRLFLWEGEEFAEFRVRGVRAGRSYKIYHSTDLKTWRWVWYFDAFENGDAVWATDFAGTLLDEPKGYFRLGPYR